MRQTPVLGLSEFSEIHTSTKICTRLRYLKVRGSNPCRVIIIDSTSLFLDFCMMMHVLDGARRVSFRFVSFPSQALRAAHFRTENTPTPFFETTRARPVARRYVKSRFFYASLTRRFIRSNKGTRSFVRSFVRSFPRVCAHYASSCRDIRE